MKRIRSNLADYMWPEVLCQAATRYLLMSERGTSLAAQKQRRRLRIASPLYILYETPGGRSGDSEFHRRTPNSLNTNCHFWNCEKKELQSVKFGKQ